MCGTDLHAFNQLDGRKLEVVVDGLPFWNGAQLAIDTTMVSQCEDGKASDVARTWKARRYPELSGEHGRTVVLGTEVCHGPRCSLCSALEPDGCCVAWMFSVDSSRFQQGFPTKNRSLTASQRTIRVGLWPQSWSFAPHSPQRSQSEASEVDGK